MDGPSGTREAVAGGRRRHGTPDGTGWCAPSFSADRRGFRIPSAWTSPLLGPPTRRSRQSPNGTAVLRNEATVPRKRKPFPGYHQSLERTRHSPNDTTDSGNNPPLVTAHRAGGSAEISRWRQPPDLGQKPSGAPDGAPTWGRWTLPPHRRWSIPMALRRPCRGGVFGGTGNRWLTPPAHFRGASGSLSRRAGELPG